MAQKAAPPMSRALARQAKLGASCRVKVPVGKGLSVPLLIRLMPNNIRLQKKYAFLPKSFNPYDKKEDCMKSKNTFVSLFIILCTVFLVGCSGAAFNAAKEKNTIVAYDKFLREYEDSEFAYQAKKLRENIKFKEAKESNTISGYDEYLKEYSDGSKMLFEILGQL